MKDGIRDHRGDADKTDFTDALDAERIRRVGFADEQHVHVASALTEVIS